MINDELYTTIDEMIVDYKKDRNEIIKKEGKECLTIAGAVALLYASDARHFIKADNYANMAFSIDSLMAILAIATGAYVYKDEERKEDKKLINKKINYLREIRKELNLGYNRFEALSTDVFKEAFDLIFQLRYYPDTVTKEYVDNYHSNNGTLEKGQARVRK